MPVSYTHLDPTVMTPDDFERWMDKAYFYMLADWVVAVSLAETSFAQEIADRWIESGEELRMSAGWSCYQWLLGNRSDSEFDTNKLRAMVQRATNTIHSQPNRTRYSMNGFIIAVGIHYLPLHNEALELSLIHIYSCLRYMPCLPTRSRLGKSTYLKYQRKTYRYNKERPAYYCRCYPYKEGTRDH